MKKLFYKKIIPAMLIVSILAPMGIMIPTKKASAFAAIVEAPVTDSILVAQFAVEQAEKAYEEAKSWYEKAITAFIRILVRVLIMTLTQSIVNWINSGFQGSPSFMTNPRGFMANLADQTVGQFIFEETKLDWLCEPFRLNIKLNLGLQYSYGMDLGCSLTGIMGNIQGAYEDFVGGDFIGGGGWDSWMQMSSNPENNAQGSYMMAESMLQLKLDTVKEEADKEINWGNGSLSLKKCTKNSYELTSDSNGSFSGATRIPKGETETFVGHPGYAVGTSYSNENRVIDSDTGVETKTEVQTNCDTTTPGALIMDTMKVSSNSWMRTLEMESVLADSIDAILGAFATLLVKTTLSKITEGLFGGEEENTDYSAQMQDLQNKFNESEMSKWYNSSSTDYYGNSYGSSTSRNPNNSSSQSVADLVSFEQKNLENYTLAYSTLDISRGEFSKAITCNINYHEDLKASLIRANVTDNIDGTAQNNTARTVPVIQFNIPYINNSASSTENKIYRLREIQNQVQTSTTDTSALLAEANTIVANSTSTTNLRKEITDWLNGSRSSYSSPTCVISTVW